MVPHSVPRVERLGPCRRGFRPLVATRPTADFPSRLCRNPARPGQSQPDRHRNLAVGRVGPPTRPTEGGGSVGSVGSVRIPDPRAGSHFHPTRPTEQSGLVQVTTRSVFSCTPWLRIIRVTNRNTRPVVPTCTRIKNPPYYKP